MFGAGARSHVSRPTAPALSCCARVRVSIMKPPRKKRSAKSVKETAMKVKKKTAMKKSRRRNSHASSRASSSATISAPATNQVPASRASESSSRILSDAVRTLSLQDAAAEIGVSAKVFISNIDARVPSDFIEGTAQVVYERTEDAVVAVKQFSDNVAFFGNIWGIQLDSNELSQPPGINDWSTAKGKQKVH